MRLPRDAGELAGLVLGTGGHVLDTPFFGSLVPRPTLAVADGLHHRYARNGSGKQPNKSRSGLFRANSDVIGVGVDPHSQ